MRRAPALLAIAGVAAIIGASFLIRWYVPDHHWLFSGNYAIGFEDLLSRTRDIFRIHHHSNVYSVHNHHQYFTYPPAALFLFWPLSWFSFHADALWWTLLCLVAAAGSIAVVWRAVAPVRGWALVAGSSWGALASLVAFPVVSIGYALGQVGQFIMVALALDYLALRGRARGVLTGVVAAIKIYPAVFILGWVWRREWRSAATAVGTGAVVSGIAWAVFPTFTRTFVVRQLFSGRELTHFLTNAHWRAFSSSPYTIFFRWPFHGGGWASPVGWLASGAVVALGIWASVRLWRAALPAASFVALMGACVLAGPVTWDHYYTFAPLLVFVAWEARHRRPLLWAALVALVVYAIPWQVARNQSFSVHGLSAHQLLIFVARNALDAATVLVMVAGLWVTRSGQRGEHAVAPPPQGGVALGGGAAQADQHRVGAG